MTYGGRMADGREVELCDECGFDTRAVADEGAAFRAAYADLEALVSGQPDASRRPAPEVFSAAEYVAHCLEGCEILLGYVAEALGRQSPSVADLSAAARLTSELSGSLTQTDRSVRLAGKYPEPVSVDWILTHLLHDTTHHALDIRRGAARIALLDLPATWTTERESPL